jgi:CubicO group peptidase (beta-lactamase class C family)
MRLLRAADVVALVLPSFLVAACASTPSSSPHRLPSGPAIAAEAERLMAREDVKGMALAVIDEGEVVHVAAFGWANVAEQRPLRTDTVMYGASLTKTAVAYFVLQLVDEGRFDLDRPLAAYLPKSLPDYEEFADLAGDDRWRTLSARHVLNHTTGLANFRWLEDDQKLRFHFAPGERYGYSGEGFYILQLALEEGLRLDVGAEMQARLFDRFGMTRTSMKWRPDFRPNLADGYAMDGKFEPHDERSSVSAPGSMDTTIADQARLWAAIVDGEGSSAASRAELVRPQFAITSAHQFPTLRLDTDPRGPAIRLSAGLGLVTFVDSSGPMFFKGGHNDWTGNMAICQETRRRCVVLLANSVRAELIYPEMVRFVLGDTAMPWWWEYNR